MLPHMHGASLGYILGKPELYLNEMAELVWGKCEVSVSVGSIRRSLKECSWSENKDLRAAREGNSGLTADILSGKDSYGTRHHYTIIAVRANSIS
jgi:hypothetical protein